MAAYQLNEHQRAEVNEAFDAFDTDKDGSITAKEMADATNSVSTDWKVTEADMLAEIRTVDANGNDALEPAEFVDWVTKKILYLQDVDSVRETFKEFDEDGDGMITAAELGKVFNKGSKVEVVDEATCQWFVRSVGKDGETIEYEEFLKMAFTI